MEKFRLMCFVFWVTKATVTHSEYVTVIASRLQQWLRERAPQLYVIRRLRVLLSSRVSKMSIRIHRS